VDLANAPFLWRRYRISCPVRDPAPTIALLFPPRDLKIRHGSNPTRELPQTPNCRHTDVTDCVALGIAEDHW